MKTSKEWLDSIKTNPSKFNAWLAKQWIAEIEAAERIHKLAETSTDRKERYILTKIANDESKHATLIGGLCVKRGIPIGKATNRYYDAVQLSKLTREQLFAVGHYAEGMRLARIEAICNDKDIPTDILEVFQIILKDEQMHEKAFLALTDNNSLNKMRGRHKLGVQALGLTL